jgi:transcriptional regulator with XRE-family HTH domain
MGEKREHAVVRLDGAAPRPSEVVAARVERERRRQGITVQRLAQRCAELGAAWLTRDVIVNIESGRRREVTLDEVWALAAALNVPPPLLQLPLGDSQRVAVTPAIEIHPHLALEWSEGTQPLVNTDRTARVRPWPEEETPDWVAAASPIYLYREMRELENEVRRALPGIGQTWRDDTQREQARAALDRLREHVEVTMRRAGIDEHTIVEEYERTLEDIGRAHRGAQSDG